MTLGIIKRLKRLRGETGKFSKGQAYYVDDAYQTQLNCGDCVHFREGKCNLVSEEGDPNPGKISPDGTCTLFNARPPRIRALQMLWGRGLTDGVAPETARATAFMFTYAALDEDPPDDLEYQALITVDKARSLLLKERFSSKSLAMNSVMPINNPNNEEEY